MKLLICSVFDNATGTYQMPFYARSKAEATRLFADACNENNSPFYKHPADFTLFAIGSFEDEAAEIIQPAMHSKIISALECRYLEQQDDPKVKKLA